LKTNARFEVVAVKRDSNNHRVIADEIIRLSSTHGQESYPDPRRRVVYRDPESGKQYVFLSNRFDLTALQIAALYRPRWQIELFFQGSKQHLKIKAFFGTSRTAVLIPIGTALIAYILLIWLKLKSIADFAVLELSRLIRTLLMERCSLWDILGPKQPPSTQNRQIPLFNFCAGH
jgi:putative transposase